MKVLIFSSFVLTLSFLSGCAFPTSQADWDELGREHHFNNLGKKPKDWDDISIPLF
jgi:hypothetical protein